MFTAEEQPLITGKREDIDKFIDCDRCLIVDWRGTEEEVLDDSQSFLPPDSLIYEHVGEDSDGVGLRVSFLGREDIMSFPPQPQNNFRVLLRLSALLQPDFDMKLFRLTDGSDTQGFLIRPKAWWDSYRTLYPKQYSEIFRDMSDLTKLWELEGPSQPPASRSKPWWKLWR